HLLRGGRLRLLDEAFDPIASTDVCAELLVAVAGLRTCRRYPNHDDRLFAGSEAESFCKSVAKAARRRDVMIGRHHCDESLAESSADDGSAICDRNRGPTSFRLKDEIVRGNEALDG